MIIAAAFRAIITDFITRVCILRRIHLHFGCSHISCQKFVLSLLFCQLLNVSVKYSLLVKQVYMRAMQFCWPLLNSRKKNQELKSRPLPALKSKIWAHERRRLYKSLLNAIVFIFEKFSFSLISFFELLDKICEPLELNTQNH